MNSSNLGMQYAFVHIRFLPNTSGIIDTFIKGMRKKDWFDIGNSQKIPKLYYVSLLYFG